MLSGSPPFVSTNPLEVMRKHEEQPVPPLPEDVPVGLALVIYGMLEKDPDKRFGTIQGVRQALAALSAQRREA